MSTLTWDNYYRRSFAVLGGGDGMEQTEVVIFSGRDFKSFNSCVRASFWRPRHESSTPALVGQRSNKRRSGKYDIGGSLSSYGGSDLRGLLPGRSPASMCNCGFDRVHGRDYRRGFFHLSSVHPATSRSRRSTQDIFPSPIEGSDGSQPPSTSMRTGNSEITEDACEKPPILIKSR